MRRLLMALCLLMTTQGGAQRAFYQKDPAPWVKIVGKTMSEVTIAIEEEYGMQAVTQPSFCKLP